MIKQYRKKPVVIEAVQFLDDSDSIGLLFEWMGRNEMRIDFGTTPPQLKIKTLEGEMIAVPGDYIIQGVMDEYYPCKPEIFHATYEEEKE